MGKRLRSGFTTGTAAAAAAKAALELLCTGKSAREVTVTLLTGDPMTIPIHDCRVNGNQSAVCTVIKDAGDDPDVTHRAVIGARVTRLDDNANRIRIRGGEGVGLVTKPGLEVAPGEPAINPGPRTMINQEIQNVLNLHPSDQTVDIEIFVPEGKTLAQKTLNSRLGILGGISILGTTGIVKPMSHEAYVATIKSSLSVASALRLAEIVMTTGRRSERYAQSLLTSLPEESFVQIGDYFKASLEIAAAKDFRRIVLAVFFGKALKMAQGFAHTHAASSNLTMEQLTQWVREKAGDTELTARVSNANTAREALGLLQHLQTDILTEVGGRMVRSAEIYAGGKTAIRGIIFNYNGQVIFDSNYETD